MMIKLKEVNLKYKFIVNYSFKEYITNFFSRKKKIFKEYDALKNLNFEIEKGKVVGIVGNNGAGKSTLLRLIAGIIKQDSGEIIIDTKSISLLALGVGFQNELSGKENIYLNGLLLGLSFKEIEEKFFKIVEFSELEEFIDMPLKTYSSGMRSKLAFSIVSHIEPELLLIDEVFSVGDSKFKKKSYHKIRELINGTRTVIMVSHSLNTIKELCDEVLWLDKGRIIMFGKTKEVIEKYEEFSNR